MWIAGTEKTDILIQNRDRCLVYILVGMDGKLHKLHKLTALKSAFAVSLKLQANEEPLPGYTGSRVCRKVQTGSQTLPDERVLGIQEPLRFQPQGLVIRRHVSSRT